MRRPDKVDRCSYPRSRTEADLPAGWSVQEVSVRDEPDVVDVDFESDTARQCGLDERAALPPGLEVGFDAPDDEDTFLALGDGTPEDIGMAFKAMSAAFLCSALGEEQGFTLIANAAPEVAGAQQVESYMLHDNDDNDENDDVDVLMVDSGVLVLFVHPRRVKAQTPRSMGLHSWPNWRPDADSLRDGCSLPELVGGEGKKVVGSRGDRRFESEYRR